MCNCPVEHHIRDTWAKQGHIKVACSLCKKIWFELNDRSQECFGCN